MATATPYANSSAKRLGAQGTSEGCRESRRSAANPDTFVPPHGRKCAFRSSVGYGADKMIAVSV